MLDFACQRDAMLVLAAKRSTVRRNIQRNVP